MEYSKFLKAQYEFNRRVDNASDELNKRYPSRSGGLVEEDVRLSDGYRKLNEVYNKAFKDLQNFNKRIPKDFSKRFRDEFRAVRSKWKLKDYRKHRARNGSILNENFKLLKKKADHPHKQVDERPPASGVEPSKFSRDRKSYMDEHEWLGDFVFSKHIKGVTLRDILRSAKMWGYDLGYVKRAVKNMLNIGNFLDVKGRIYPGRDEHGREMDKIMYASELLRIARDLVGTDLLGDYDDLMTNLYDMEVIDAMESVDRVLSQLSRGDKDYVLLSRLGKLLDKWTKGYGEGDYLKSNKQSKYDKLVNDFEKLGNILQGRI